MGAIIRMSVVLIAIGALTLAGVAGWMMWRLNASAPQLEGALSVEGVAGAVVIARDGHGVPHIFAERPGDTAFGLGYAHAQDRLFQMDVLRRSALGERAALLGPDAVRHDAAARLLRRAERAAAFLNNAPRDLRDSFEAYAAGVNALLNTPGFAAPPEFLLLANTPRAWTAADSAAILLARHDADPLMVWDAHAAHRALENTLGAAQLQAFAPLAPDGAGGAAWAVSGDRTSAGAPMLAAQAYDRLSIETQLYLARMARREGPTAGATLPGLPFILQGRNARAAWSVVPARRDRAAIVRRPADAVTRSWSDSIAVRDGAAVSVQLRETAEGPVMAPIVQGEAAADEAFGPRDGSLPVLTGARRGTLAGVAALYQALNASAAWPRVEAAWAQWDGAPSHLVYAEATAGGGIVAGLPRLAEMADGIVIRAGAPREESTGDGAAAPGLFDAYRPQRLEALLSATRLHDADRFAAILSDPFSPPAARLRVAASRAKPQTAIGRVLQIALRDWDARMTPDGVEPLIFEAWLAALPARLWADELGPAFAGFAQPRVPFIDQELNGPASLWCDDVRTPAAENCALIAGQAFDDAGQTLAAVFGLDAADEALFLSGLMAEDDTGAFRLRWGAVRAATFVHPAMHRAPHFLTRRFTLPQPLGGGAHSLALSEGPSGQGADGAPFAAQIGVTYRAIHDLSDLDRARFMIAPGQSGHPQSPHYRDLAADWAAGRNIAAPADWPQAARAPGEPLEGWVAEAAPPGARILVLLPSAG